MIDNSNAILYAAAWEIIDLKKQFHADRREISFDFTHDLLMLPPRLFIFGSFLVGRGNILLSADLKASLPNFSRF